MFFDICWSDKICKAYNGYHLYHRNLKFQKDISIFKSALRKCIVTHAFYSVGEFVSYIRVLFSHCEY